MRDLAHLLGFWLLLCGAAAGFDVVDLGLATHTRLYGDFGVPLFGVVVALGLALLAVGNLLDADARLPDTVDD